MRNRLSAANLAGGYGRQSCWILLGLVSVLALSLMGCASEVDVEQLYVEANSHDYEARTEARRTLQDLVDQKVVEPFARGLQSENSETRVQSILNLMAINTPEAVEALLPELELSRRFNVYYHPVRLQPTPQAYDSRAMVAYIIRLNGGHPDALKILAGTYGQEEDAKAREATVMALGTLHDKGAIPILTRALRDPDDAVMKTALEGLRSMQAPDLFQALMACVDDENPDVQIRCAEHLGYFPGEEFTTAVLDLLKRGPAPPVRGALLGALAGTGGDRAFEALVDILRSGEEDPTIRQKAVEGLQAMTAQSLGTDPDQWERWWKENMAHRRVP